MDLDQLFPSKYLKAADLNGRPAVGTINRVVQETMKDGTIKAVLYFNNKQKGLVLNKTNSAVIAKNYGNKDIINKWVGQRIELYPAMVEFKGEQIEGIRVRMPSPPVTARVPEMAPPAPVAAPEPKTTTAQDMNDEIPW